MLNGNIFYGNNVDELRQSVKKGIPGLPLSLSKECNSFLNSMLDNDPNKRLSAKDLLNYDFIVKDSYFFKINASNRNNIVDNLVDNNKKIDINNNPSKLKLSNKNNQKLIININNKNKNIVNKTNNEAIQYNKIKEEHSKLENSKI